MRKLLAVALIALAVAGGVALSHVRRLLARIAAATTAESSSPFNC
jgi:hypothetical protein